LSETTLIAISEDGQYSAFSLDLVKQLSIILTVSASLLVLKITQLQDKLYYHATIGLVKF
jgi:hypothetical protein